jgi:tetratricopeptide (TPR) repeat protein
LSEGKSPDYPLSMTAAWQLSVRTLQEQLPQARELLRCCAFFGPEPIPRDVFRRGTPASATGIGGVMSDPIVLARVIRELGRFALVTIDGRSITVHRLVQALLRDELSDEAQERYRHDVHLILAAADPKNPDDERLWPRYRELVAHMASGTTELAECQVPAVRQFALNVMRYLYNSGDLTACQFLAERFIAQWTQDSGQESPDVLGARRHLGNALRRLGRYGESYEMTQTTLGAAGRILGERDALTLSLRRSFGADLRARGDFAAARELDEQTRDLLEEAYDPADGQILPLLASLALDQGLNSAYVAARDLYQRVYLLMSEASPDIPAADMLGAWNGLGWAVRLCGNYAEARDVSEDAWDYGRERLGPDHLATLRSATGVSIASRRILAAREDGLKIARDTFEMCTRLFGDSNPETMAAAISLTNMQRTIGRLDEAADLAEQTVSRYPDVYGPQHPYNYGCTGNLALLRRVTGNTESARELNEQALAGLDERLTRDHHYALTVAVNLASDLATLGMTSDARALGEGTLRRLRKLLGEKHPVTLGCAANLSIDLRADGAVEAAEGLKAETMARYAATLGADHPDALVAAADQRLDLDFDPAPI